jgi:protein-tyrosine-phosphatase
MKRLLFVCVENSCRSQIAEAFARIHGSENLEAYSAGSRPSGTVNPKAIATMKEIGYDLSLHLSKSLDDLPDVQWDFVATMGCGGECPHIRAKQREDWQIADPRDMPPDQFRKVRDEIEGKVKVAFSSLSDQTGNSIVNLVPTLG